MSGVEKCVVFSDGLPGRVRLPGSSQGAKTDQGAEDHDEITAEFVHEIVLQEAGKA
jgi:hypothetical protein